MASKIDVSALTLNAEEAMEVAEAVVELVFRQGELADVHHIEEGVHHQKQIVFVDNLDVGGEAFTNCTPAEQAALVMSEKFWTPALIGGRWTHCANDMNQLMKLFKKAQRTNPDFFDRIDSEEMGLLMAKVAESLKVSISAKAWLSDTAAAAQPAGNFTAAGVNLGLWNQFDGLWKQIFADGAVPVHTITENGGASYLLQELAADAGLAILRGIYQGADSRLVGHPEAQILVTRSIYDNLMTTIEDKEFNGGITKRLENGLPTLEFRGIPVKVQYEWDRTIRKFQDDLTVHFRPHRAVMTTPMNIQIGTVNEGDLHELDSFYDRTDKTNIVDVAYFLDAKFGESYMASVAY